MTRRKYPAQDLKKADRRSFLKGATAFGGGAAVSMILPGMAEASTETHDQSQERSTETGYRVTEHVSRYYQTLKS